MKTNIITTLCGVCTLAASVYMFTLGQATTAVALLPVALGLMGAKDFNVTGGTKEQ